MVGHMWQKQLIFGFTSGVDFINVLHTAFTYVASQSIRTQSSCQYLFMLLGSTCVKAVHRTLMKLSPVVMIRWQNSSLLFNSICSFFRRAKKCLSSFKWLDDNGLKCNLIKWFNFKFFCIVRSFLWYKTEQQQFLPTRLDQRCPTLRHICGK